MSRRRSVATVSLGRVSPVSTGQAQSEQSFASPESKPRMHRTRKPEDFEEDFEVDLEKRTARHRVCGTTFLFYNYETLDGLRPHLLAGESPEWPWQELAEPATKAFRLAEKGRAGR